MPWVVPAIAAVGSIAAAKMQSDAAKKQSRALSGIGSERRFTDSSNVNSYRYGPAINDVGYVQGYTSIDPSIRALREGTLKNLPGYRNTLTQSYGMLDQNLGDIRNTFASNTNPYIQARVNPLLESGARQRGSLTQGLARRGIFGPLASQSMDTFESSLSRQEADQRALATNEQLASLLGIDTQRFNAALSNVQALQGLDQAQQSVAAQNLAQELAALGLSQADTGAILGAAGLNLQQQQLQQATIGRGLYALGAGLEGMGGYQTGWDTSSTGMDIGL